LIVEQQKLLLKRRHIDQLKENERENLRYTWKDLIAEGRSHSPDLSFHICVLEMEVMIFK